MSKSFDATTDPSAAKPCGTRTGLEFILNTLTLILDQVRTPLSNREHAIAALAEGAITYSRSDEFKRLVASNDSPDATADQPGRDLNIEAEYNGKFSLSSVANRLKRMASGEPEHKVYSDEFCGSSNSRELSERDREIAANEWARSFMLTEIPSRPDISLEEQMRGRGVREMPPGILIQQLATALRAIRDRIAGYRGVDQDKYVFVLAQNALSLIPPGVGAGDPCPGKRSDSSPGSPENRPAPPVADQAADSRSLQALKDVRDAVEAAILVASMPPVEVERFDLEDNRIIFTDGDSASMNVAESLVLTRPLRSVLRDREVLKDYPIDSAILVMKPGVTIVVRTRINVTKAVQ